MRICDYACYGCTESGAVNYDATAIYDDGTCCYEEYFFFLEVGGGSWDGEISWNIRNMETNTVVDFGGAGTHAVCLPEGCYNFEMFDSFQDGWNNGIYTFSTYDGQPWSTPVPSTRPNSETSKSAVPTASPSVT